MSIFSKPIFMALALAVAMPVAAQAAGKSQTVQFASGQIDANYRGSVRGYDYDRYTFNAQQGQLLNIRTDGSNPHIVAVVNYLGKGDGALLQTQDQVLPYSGRYEVRVMQTRNGARKSNQARPYVLNIAITGTPAPAVAATSAAARQVDVRFAPGSNAAAYRGTIRGYTYDSYRVRARQGQVLSVDSQGSNGYIVTTVSQVDSRGQLTALPEGIMMPDSTHILPQDGLYDIEVRQMRAGARNNSQSRPYRLSIQID